MADDAPKPPATRPTPGVPAPVPPAGGATLQREALERVLARAAELQSSGGGVHDTMTEAELVALGEEVGLSPEHMRQALAEERTRMVSTRVPAGSVAGWFGPGSTSAQRVIRGTPSDVLAALDQWMQREECMVERRRFGDRLTWEPRRDFLGSIKRGFNVGGRGYALARASEVAATAIAVDEARVLVRLDADVSVARRNHAIGGAAAAGTGLLGAGGVMALALAAPEASIPLASAVAVLWGGMGAGITSIVARAQRESAARVQLALEQVLDRLEHDAIARKPASGTLLDMLTTAARRVR
jgi:hypothetical protein